jgi:hypothetical protein
VIFFLILAIVMLVINIGRDGVNVIESLNIGRVIVTLHLLWMNHIRITIFAVCNGRNDRSCSVFDDAILHAQLEEDVFERTQSVERKQVMGRLFSQQVTRTHQANL